MLKQCAWFLKREYIGAKPLSGSRQGKNMKKLIFVSRKADLIMLQKKSPLEQAGEELRWSAISAALIYLVLGLIFILKPHESSLFFCYVIGAALTGYGIFYFISFAMKATKTGTSLLIGVLSTAFGIYTLFRPSAIQGILFITLGILIVLNSLSSMRHASLLKAFAFPGWWVLALLSVLTTVLGFLIIFNFELFGSFLMMMIGCIMVYEALSGLWAAHRIYQLKKVWNHTEE